MTDAKERLRVATAVRWGSKASKICSTSLVRVQREAASSHIAGNDQKILTAEELQKYSR